jgi:hypothetical protein
MKTYIQAQAFDVWRSITDVHKAPTTPSKEKYGNKLEENYSRDRNTIENGLNLSIHTKIMHFNSTKEMWDKLKTIYKGVHKVKEAKLHIFRAKFEQLKMNDYENTTTYAL